MDEQFIRRLETRAYYAVVRALSASHKLTFDTETLLMDLQSALNLNDDAAQDLMAQVENDQEVQALKQYDPSVTRPTIPALVTSGGGPVGGSGAPLHTAKGPGPLARMPTASSSQQYVGDGGAGLGGPLSKKQRKAGPPGGGVPRAQANTSPPPSRTGGGGGAGAGTKQRQRPGGAVPSAGGGGGGAPAAAPRTVKAAPPQRLTLGAATFTRVMQRGSQEDMAAYLQELNQREREIFTELISQGVDESDTSDFQLNDLTRELLRWYKLDQRQSALAQQLAAVG